MSNRLLTYLGVALVAASAHAQFQPGDVFSDHTWRAPSSQGSQRITGSDATDVRARANLPNPVNKVRLPDLTGAIRATAIVELLTSHHGTHGAKIRVNGNAWIPIPYPNAADIPGNRGQGLPVEEYLTMRYVSVRVPLNQLKKGDNTFEFDCSGKNGTALGRVWPQHLVYATTFRIFWDASKKTHATGQITSPAPIAVIDKELIAFTVKTAGANQVASVEYIGNYDDFNWRGNGKTGEWQHIIQFGKTLMHMGTATAAPWGITWDNTWIPTQRDPFDVVALIRDTTGVVYVTQPVAGLTLRRSKHVVRYKASGIPRAWQTSAVHSPHSCEVNVTRSLTKAIAAKLYMVTWNGVAADAIGINGKPLNVTPIGFNHNLFHHRIQVPVSRIRQGKNTLYTQSNTTSHGIEVQWPGMELFVRYDVPETWAQYVLFGRGCVGSKGEVKLANRGVPRLGQGWSVDLTGAPSATIAALLVGASAEQWGQFQLPFDFTPQGATNCQLYTSLDLIYPVVTSPTGAASFSVVSPNVPALIGVSIFNQYVVVDLGANPLNSTFTNGGRGTFGTW